MAVRQYIGARYVAKIYVNSLDPSSADWESGVAYEPLTMVTYNSSSYISRKAVAASVGNPAANPEYWAVTGLYNGQIAQLQNDVDALEAYIAEFNGSKIMMEDLQLVAEPDGVKTFGELLDDLYAQLNAYISGHTGVVIRVLSGGLAGAFGFPKYNRLQTSFSGDQFVITTVTTSHVYVYCYDIESTSSKFLASTDNSITDNSAVTADSNMYLNVEIYKRFQ